MKRFGQASRRMDWVGIVLLSMMLGVSWLNSALASDVGAVAPPDTAGVLEGENGGTEAIGSVGIEVI